jgi:poly-beta-hydroxybutyrate-responsive repressor
LLLLLHEGTAHGYDLTKALEDFGFAGAAVDSSVVYRVLREMEEREWVASTWDTDGAGPPRRVYRLTQEGDSALSAWVEDLQEVRDSLDRYLAAYEQHIREGQGEHH